MEIQLEDVVCEHCERGYLPGEHGKHACAECTGSGIDPVMAPLRPGAPHRPVDEMAAHVRAKRLRLRGRMVSDTPWQARLGERVKQAVDDLGEGAGAIFIVEGPSGVGKTTVARHVVDQLGPERAVLLAGVPGHFVSGFALTVFDNADPGDVRRVVMSPPEGVVLINGVQGLVAAGRRNTRRNDRTRVVHLVRVAFDDGNSPMGMLTSWLEMLPNPSAA